MRAGRLRERLIFQRRIQLPADEHGVVERDWMPLRGAVSSSVEPLRSTESLIADRQSNVTSYRIQTRFCSELASLTTTDRAVDARNPARVFNLKSVMVGPKRDWIDITAETGVGT